MTALFDTSDLVDLGARRAGHLPTPSRDRFQPLRAGILNVWEYDDQQFWFEDGRLLLRGRNEAGKSKALELLFPFVLDGDISPKKLDPFGTVSKSMFWNMIDFSRDRNSAIGYLWLEFGRCDGDTFEYVTVIVGVQATRAERRVSTWFAVTPQRVDVDLDLAPGSVCRTQDQFAQALGADARFTTRATQHRANVASLLYNMSPERFDNLLHLTRRLREPKLGDKINVAKLSAVLTEALPPLDEMRLQPLADGFGYLDADIDALARVEASHDAAGTFMELYRRYARTQARRRADDVRAATTAFDDITRRVREDHARVEEAKSTRDTLNTESEQLRITIAATTGSLGGLDLSTVQNLENLRRDADSAARLSSQARTAATRARADAADAADAARTAHTELLDASVSLEHAATEAHTAAKAGRIADEWDDDDRSVAADRLVAAVAARRHLLGTVDAAQRAAVTAEQKMTAAAARFDAANEAAGEAETVRVAAVDAADAARDRFMDVLAVWADDIPGGMVMPIDTDAVLAQVTPLVSRGDRATAPVAETLAKPLVDIVDAAVEVARAAEHDARTARTVALAALAEHDDAPADAAPPVRAGIGSGRVGLPLFLAVAFTDTVTADERAGLEAALEASGLLDAAVHRDGLISDDDTVIVPAGDDGSGQHEHHGVLDWIEPVDGPDSSLVRRVLRRVGAGRDSGQECWVDVDGSWRNGPLTGRWSKLSVDYIGAAARAAARARRRNALVASLDAAESGLRTADAALVEAQRAGTAARQWVASFPTVVEWSAAERALESADTVAFRAAAAVRAAHERVGAVRGEAAEVLDTLERAVAAARCRPEEVPEQRGILDRAADAARDLRYAAEMHRRAVTASTAADVRADELDVRATASEREGTEANEAAAATKGRYETAFALEGAEASQIIEEQERLERELETSRARFGVVQGLRDTAVERLATAEAELREAGRRRDEAIERRSAALGGLETCVRTGIVALVVALDVDRDAASYAQPAAGLTLARQISRAVDDEEATDVARSQAHTRMTEGYARLRSEIGTDFDPHLDDVDELLVATATINGEVVGVGELHARLGSDAEQRRRAILSSERELIEKHLRAEVGNHLGERLHTARDQINHMNKILRSHPTNSGATVQLEWKVDPDSGPGVKAALDALLTSPATRDDAGQAAMSAFLAERVAMARSGEVGGADLAERLLATLDYRRWHSFKLSYRTSAGESEMTARTVGSGSGGQQAKVAHLPLLAATAAFYESSPAAPRLCFLDEAFAGIDGPNTTDLLAVSVELDLDMVMTNYEAWFCVPELPALAIYHLEKVPGTLGVAAIRYEWNGTGMAEKDLWLDP
jgi:uncharacterized protein (TIGR02680 family)